MKYIIGVDSGGTKTEAVLYDLAGNEQQRATAGFGNMLVDHEQGLANIKSAVKDILTGREASDCQLLVLGLAGIDSGGLRETLMKELAVFQVPVVLLNDAHLAHYSLLKGESGILVIAGTGSVCLGMKQGEWYRVGGWGHLFGDEGSGYYIGKRAIQQALSEYDAGTSNSLLTDKLFAHFNITTTLELVKIAYQLTKDQIAALAQIVAEAASAEPIAAAILEDAGRLLGEEVEKTARKMNIGDKQVTIGLNGSVIERNDIVRQAFFNYLARCPFDLIVAEKEASSTKGAYYYFQKNGEA